MKVDVRFFASLADATGAVKTNVEVPAGADVTALWETLVERYPRLAATGYRPLVACDMEYANWESALDGVREVAFLPPLSGG